jgi:hypothetical protein
MNTAEMIDSRLDGVILPLGELMSILRDEAAKFDLDVPNAEVDAAFTLHQEVIKACKILVEAQEQYNNEIA